jgi:hypothetical protein
MPPRLSAITGGLRWFPVQISYGIRDTWTPLAVGVGLKRIAVVLSSRGLGKIASEEVLSQIGKTAFVTRTFGTISEAIEWAVDEEAKSESR